MIKQKVDNYFLFQTDKGNDFEVETLGKWMFFFSAKDLNFAVEICEKAINEDICVECKCSDIKYVLYGEEHELSSGVVCFYCNNILSEHKKIINFMLENELIRTTNYGRLYNISFKYSERCTCEEKPFVCLDDLMDLYSAEWLK